MRQGFAITLILGTLFLLWLVNTGRWDAFSHAFTTALDASNKSRTQPTGGITQVNPNPPTTPQNPFGGGFRVPGFPPTGNNSLPVAGVFGGIGGAGLMGFPFGYGGYGYNVQDPSSKFTSCAFNPTNPQCASVFYQDIFKYPGQTIKDILDPVTSIFGFKL